MIATKLYDKGSEVKESAPMEISQNAIDFFKPFINNGKLDAKIIIGDPSPHGQYNASGTDGAHVVDLMLFLGRFLNSFDYPNYKLDTEIDQSDLQNNLILIGNNRTNAVIDKINSSSPIHFDTNSITSKVTKNTYKDDRCGMVLKIDSPFNKNKKFLIIGGLRTRGTRAAIISLFKLIDNNFLNVKNLENVQYVVQGLDKDSDMIVDDVMILE